VRESPAFSTAASHKNATKFEMYIPKKWINRGQTGHWVLAIPLRHGEEQIGV
jgi:hypothetical protein